LGLAVGDALGTTLEFKPPGSFPALTDMVGGGPFHLEPGQWTDDTSMALCLAESLMERQGFASVDQLARYLRWARHGHLSSNGRCFDIGNTIRAALQRLEQTHALYRGATVPMSAGDGSLMQLAPVPLAYAHSSAVDACGYLGGVIAGAHQGASKEELLADHYSPIPGYWEAQPLVPEIAAVAAGSFRCRHSPEIRGTGYVVQCLEVALWTFDQSESLATMPIPPARYTGNSPGRYMGSTVFRRRGVPNWRTAGRSKRLPINSFNFLICYKLGGSLQQLPHTVSRPTKPKGGDGAHH
jgi:ADP-ribosyl-[dinitrogen reductase] hydrolase